MTQLKFECVVHAGLDRVWQFHDDVRSLLILTPPTTKVTLKSNPEPMSEGVIFRLGLKRWGLIPLPTWHARITQYRSPNGFVDEQMRGKGPFKYWQHEHHFEAIDESYTHIVDSVSYEAPFGILGRFVDWVFIKRDIEKMFAYRHAVTKRELER